MDFFRFQRLSVPHLLAKDQRDQPELRREDRNRLQQTETDSDVPADSSGSR
jgi:hypothetical protein